MKHFHVNTTSTELEQQWVTKGHMTFNVFIKISNTVLDGGLCSSFGYITNASDEQLILEIQRTLSQSFKSSQMCNILCFCIEAVFPRHMLYFSISSHWLQRHQST